VDAESQVDGADGDVTEEPVEAPTPDVIVAGLDRLAVAFDGWKATAVAQREEQLEALRRRSRLERVVTVSLVSIAVSLPAMVVGVIVTLFVLSRMADLQASNHEVLSVIRDCTDSTGQCAQRGQQGTADAVAGINDVGLANDLCALLHPRYADAKACAAKLLAPPPPPKPRPNPARIR
jgi:hypothetical protein